MVKIEDEMAKTDDNCVKRLWHLYEFALNDSNNYPLAYRNIRQVEGSHEQFTKTK